MSRLISLNIVIILLCIMLTGCLSLREPQTETIIIEEIETEMPSEEPSLLEVKTIYPVLEGQREPYLVGWSDSNAILSLTYPYPNPARLDRVNHPYVSRVKVMDVANVSQMWKLPVLSPDGRELAYIESADDLVTLNLLTFTEDRNKVDIDSQELSGNVQRSIPFELSWSNNSRYLGLLMRNEEDVDQLKVFDAKEGKMNSYLINRGSNSEFITSAYISDDGKSAVIVKLVDRNLYMLEYGQLDGDVFVGHYEHPIRDSDSWVEWIHPDQIAFVGADGSLYAYDQRNDAVSVLLENIRFFRLSQDRQFIVFTKDDGSIYAANLYGNTMLNIKQIYQGLVAVRMSWSPDNKKLMIGGYVREPKAAELIISGLQYLVIEFK